MTGRPCTEVAHWLIHGERGRSSECIAITAIGGEFPDAGSRYPRDGADFRRCSLLMRGVGRNAILEHGLLVLAQQHAEWKVLLEYWRKLDDLLELELGPLLDGPGPAPRTTALLEGLIDSVTDTSQERGL